jgi:hypothetical protein
LVTDGVLTAADPGAAQAAQHYNPRYRWRGPLDHDAAREQIRRSQAHA